MSNQPENESWIEQALRDAASGDADAWRRIVEAYMPRVYGLLWAQCRNRDLAEEITQSTFCTIVAKIASYAESGRFEQWLFRIAMNRLRDEMRRRGRQARPVDDDALAGMAASETVRDPFARQDLEVHGALRDAMAKLPEADQQIVHLRHLAGLSFKQIAAMLDEPLGTVLARQHRALKKLRDLLEGQVEES